MSLRIQPHLADGTVAAPPSKSHTHRAYILAALSGNGSLRSPLVSDDTQATLQGLQALGMLATQLPHETRVGGTLRAPRQPVDARSSGTTLRLLTAVAALQAGPVRFTASAQLQTRPMAPLLAALEQLGAKTTSTDGHAPLSVQGPLRGGRATLPGTVSSQFVSALLLAAPALDDPTEVRIQGPLVSAPYVDVTLHQLAHHGVRVERASDGFRVPGGQRVRQKPYTVPGDYSSAAFPLAAAAVTGGAVTVTGLDPEDPQGDRAILDHLRAFGARVDAGPAGVRVHGGRLQGAAIDVGPTPDLFPVLCAVAACASGTSRLHGAAHLRAKESDRVHAMADNLTRAGIECQEQPDGITIKGGIPKGITIASYGDHRIAMALSVLALASKGSSTLPDAEVVAKSYPAFLTDLARIAPEALLA